MWNSLKKLDCILDRSDFRKLLLLLIPASVMALLEVLGIFSILPFMQLVADPDITETDSRFRWLTGVFEFSSRRSMLIWLGSAVLSIYAVSAVFSVFTGWLIHRVIWSFAHRISMNLLNHYTRQPYSYFLTHNSAEMVKKAIADIHSLVSGVLMVSCQFVLNAIKSAAILTLLLIVNFRLALLAFVVYGGVYFLIHVVRHRYLRQLGQERLDTILVRLKSFSETLSGIKTLRVSGATGWFVNRFEVASKKFCGIQPKFQLYTLIPLSLVEFLAFGGIVTVILYQLLSGQELTGIIPVLSVFAMATYKLLPALSLAFTQASVLSHNSPVVDEVHDDMQNFNELLKPIEEFHSAKRLAFENNIRLDNISYQFESSGLPVLRNIDIQILKNQKCAFVGSTGCGKSTLVDIMVGLLTPQEGHLRIDSEIVTSDNVYGWQNQLAYVPQDVFLFDDTIAANIALGVPTELIDRKKLQESARLAQVEEFLRSDFREGYNTVVGEKGVRLSGGQRQRIGLARVFYQQPNVLFLDEATSALDSITEEAILRAIEQEMPQVTMIMVAHRLTSTRFCDLIFFMDGGRIVDCGSFEQLMRSSTKFRQMVEITG